MVLFKCMRTLSPEEKLSKELDQDIKQWQRNYDNSIKLLLLGTGDAGKTTIIKQMRILHVQGYSDKERQDYIDIVRGNLHDAIYSLVSHLTLMEPSLDFQDDDSEISGNYILAMGPHATIFSEEYYDHVQRLWEDLGIRECYRRSNEFQLIDSAKYFLDRIYEIRKENYVPIDQDILHSKQTTIEIQKVEFSVNVSKNFYNGTQEFWMFDVGGQRGERKKWIQVFEGIHAVLFVVACSDFDQNLCEDNKQNRLKESITLFTDVWNSRFLVDAGFIVFLNKQDILKDKIESGKDIGIQFPEYDDYKLSSKDGNSFDHYYRTRCFIRDTFVKITQQKRDNVTKHIAPGITLNYEETKLRDCYYHFTTATDTDNIKTVFDDVHSMIIETNLRNSGVSGVE
ncbi:guanine nucleotide-binding protein G(f) subunit alpha isoform X2 [Cephus cinctus]|uniref:Guanine nucleotide-binding protein G(s) subunit alpha n=1 Tax=Cephus cinctus TaxID=211228 RepID=A0AAJ7FES7_CEPCN|nr:guanine nucleotide-binding protein G(f) subunit alpha isoform X2 [Cephus cinctus]